MNPHIRSLKDIFDFNSTMIHVGLADLRNEDAVHQVRQGEGSSISFLVGHMLSSRVAAPRSLRAATDNPYADLFGGNVGARDGSAYPDIARLHEDWQAVAQSLGNAVAGLSEEEALQPHTGFPVPDQTVRGALMFWAWHESYHVGQVGLMRTEMGYPSLQAQLYAAMQPS